MSEVKGHTADYLQVRGGACDLRGHPPPLGQALREGGAHRVDTMPHRLQERGKVSTSTISGGGGGTHTEGKKGTYIHLALPPLGIDSS